MATYKRISGDYNIETLNASDDININTSNVNVDGNLVIAGNVFADIINADFFVGDGRFLSNVNVSNVSLTTTNIANGTSNVNIPVANGNIRFAVNSTSNVLVVSTLGANITTGTVSTSNITGALTINGGVGVVGNVYADEMYSNNTVVLNANSVISGGTY